MNKLKTPPVIVYLGAGASAIAKYCTFENFADILLKQDIREKEGLSQLQLPVISFLKEVKESLVLSHKPTTHDNFLWALNDYKKFWRILRVNNVLWSRFVDRTKLETEYFHFSDIVQQAICAINLTTIYHYAANNVKKAPKNKPLYESFRKVYDLYKKIAILNNKKIPFLPIFTTNYDLFIEDLYFEFESQSNNFKLINGIPGLCNPNQIWNCDNYRLQNNLFTGIHLFRLHGCIAWYHDSNNRGKIFYSRPSSFGTSLNDLYICYPGNESLLGINPHAYGFKILYNMLHKCRLIIFIGFSFRDHDILHILLSSSSNRSEPLNILVVDPYLNNNDVIFNLEQASKTTQFPVKLPNINCLNVSFGTQDSFEKIYCYTQNF